MTGLCRDTTEDISATKFKYLLAHLYTHNMYVMFLVTLPREYCSMKCMLWGQSITIVTGSDASSNWIRQLHRTAPIKALDIGLHYCRRDSSAACAVSTCLETDLNDIYVLWRTATTIELHMDEPRSDCVLCKLEPQNCARRGIYIRTYCFLSVVE